MKSTIRCSAAALLLLAAACSPQPEGEPPPTVIPVPQHLDAAKQLVQRIDDSLGAWQKASTELVDYSGDGGEMVFWFFNETVRKIEATLPGKEASAHWQVYYTSAQTPFFAVYRETPNDRDAADAQGTTQDAFAFLKNEALHVYVAGAPVDEPPVSLDEVRAFALQLVQSVHQK